MLNYYDDYYDEDNLYLQTGQFGEFIWVWVFIWTFSLLANNSSFLILIKQCSVELTEKIFSKSHTSVLLLSFLFHTKKFTSDSLIFFQIFRSLILFVYFEHFLSMHSPIKLIDWFSFFFFFFPSYYDHECWEILLICKPWYWPQDLRGSIMPYVFTDFESWMLITLLQNHNNFKPTALQLC